MVFVWYEYCFASKDMTGMQVIVDSELLMDHRTNENCLVSEQVLFESV